MNWYVCRQVTDLPTTRNKSAMLGVSLRSVILIDHVPSRRRTVDNAGARYVSAGSLRDFGVVRTIDRGFVADKAPFACNAFYKHSYFFIHAAAAAKTSTDPERIRLFLHFMHALKLHWNAHCGCTGRGFSRDGRRKQAQSRVPAAAESAIREVRPDRWGFKLPQRKSQARRNRRRRSRHRCTTAVTKQRVFRPIATT